MSSQLAFVISTEVERSRIVLLMRTYYVYIMSNPRRTTLYVGVTNDLERRVMEHKTHSPKGFTDTYNCTDLVYFEETTSVEQAITREKQLKKWGRAKKDNLINQFNPSIRDLSTSSRWHWNNRNMVKV